MRLEAGGGGTISKRIWESWFESFSFLLSPYSDIFFHFTTGRRSSFQLYWCFPDLMRWNKTRFGKGIKFFNFCKRIVHLDDESQILPHVNTKSQLHRTLLWYRLTAFNVISTPFFSLGRLSFAGKYWAQFVKIHFFTFNDHNNFSRIVTSKIFYYWDSSLSSLF